VLYSEQFDNASWVKDSSATVTANTTTAPDGNTTADTINIAAVANSRINQVININNSTTYTISGYFKNIALASGQNIALIYGNTNSFGPPNNFTATASIDLFNGTATYSLTGTSGTGFSGSASGSIQNVGNGWYRVTLTFTTGTAAATGGVFRLMSLDVVSARSFYAWGMQMEAGAYPTTYIPTTSATATRVADSAVKTGISSIINSQQGTLYVNCRALFNGGSFRGISISDGTYANRIAIVQSSTANTLLIAFVIGSTFIVNQSISGYTQTNLNKVAVSWGSGTLKVFINGSLSNTFTSITMPSSNLFTRIGFDAGASGSEFEGFIQQMALFPTPLSDTDCAAITSL